MRITKTKFLFIFLLLLFYQSFSQSLTYEVFGGVNISNLKSSVNHKGSRLRVSLDSRTAYFFGGSIEFPMNIVKGYNFLLNIQLQYSLQGSSFYFMHDGGRQYDKVNQINLPFRIKFELLKNFFIGAGGYIGYLVHVDDYLYEDENNYSDFDAGIVTSIQYKIFKKLSIEAKYLFGLTDILNREFDSGEYKHDDFNSVFQIGLNYKI